MSDTDTLERLRYPVGRFAFPQAVTGADRARSINEIERAPAVIRAAVRSLSNGDIDTSYRPGGWTVRQVVHHVPDSHLNAYCRFKLALTEDQPTIKPYDEAAWAELSDSRTTPVEVSLVLLESLHERWVRLLRSMSASDFSRTFVHPEHGRVLTLDQTLALYDWHGRHHAGHIAAVLSRAGQHATL